MSIATLEQFKQFVRELTGDLDTTFQIALDSASAEVDTFVGFDVLDEFGTNGPPSDIVMACMLLAQCHADAGTPNDNEYRRGAAHSLLRPYRIETGVAA